MRLIGLTGRSGCGKTTVGELAKTMGFLVMDCDAIYKEITSRPGACLDAIRNTFGFETVREGKLYIPPCVRRCFSIRGRWKSLTP